MTASTAQGTRIFVSASNDTDGAVSDWTKIADPVNVTPAIPIAGDLEATTLESTIIEMADDLVEEISLQVSCHHDMTDSAQKQLVAIQASKTKSAFLIEVPEPGVETVTTYHVIGWVRNFQPSLAPRTIQGVTFDILTRQAVAVVHGATKQ